MSGCAHPSPAKCACLECCIRQQVTGLHEAPGEASVNDALNALGEVTAEILAHLDTKTAKRFAQFLLVRRKDWQRHPRVMAQQTKGPVQ